MLASIAYCFHSPVHFLLSRGILSFFRKVCIRDVANLLFLRVRPNIKPAVDNNAWFFFEKVFLKGISPADHSLQQHKTVLQIAKCFFLLGV